MKKELKIRDVVYYYDFILNKIIEKKVTKIVDEGYAKEYYSGEERLYVTDLFFTLKEAEDVYKEKIEAIHKERFENRVRRIEDKIDTILDKLNSDNFVTLNGNNNFITGVKTFSETSTIKLNIKGVEYDVKDLVGTVKKLEKEIKKLKKGK